MSLFPKGVNTFVLRSGRITDAQRAAYDLYMEKYSIPFSQSSIDFNEILGRDTRIIIEIGFGMGECTALIASADPVSDYIGIEVHKPGIGKLLSEIHSKNLGNLKIIEHDAVEVITKMIKSSSVDGFHIFFPDPWPKKRHHKRRLIQRPFTDLLKDRLKPDGYIHFATDWFEYAEFALNEFTITPELENVSNKKWADRPIWRPKTKFEQRAEKEGRSIFEIHMVKIFE